MIKFSQRNVLMVPFVTTCFAVALLQYRGLAVANDANIEKPESIWVTGQTKTSISVAWTPVDDSRLQSYNLRLNGNYTGWTQPGVHTYSFNNLKTGVEYSLGVLAVEVPAKLYSDDISITAMTRSGTEVHSAMMNSARIAAAQAKLDAIKWNAEVHRHTTATLSSTTRAEAYGHYAKVLATTYGETDSSKQAFSDAKAARDSAIANYKLLPTSSSKKAAYRTYAATTRPDYVEAYRLYKDAIVQRFTARDKYYELKKQEADVQKPPAVEMIKMPDDIWIISANGNSVTVGWSAVSDTRLQSYNLALNGVYAGWTDPSTTEFIFDGLSLDTDYQFGVRSVEVPAEVYSALSTVSYSNSAATCDAPERYQTASINGNLYGFVDSGGIPRILNGINVRSAVKNNAARYSQSEFNDIASKGFDHIRLPLDWHQFEPSDGVFNNASLTALDEVIDRAQKAGLGVILDPIHLKNNRSANYWGVPAWAWGDIDPAMTKVFDELKDHSLPYLKMITSRYCSNSNVIAIDLVNEPREPARGTPSSKAQELISMYGDWVSALRAIDSNKLILLEPFYGSTRFSASTIAKLSSHAQLIWSVHDYYAGEGVPSNGFSNLGYSTVGPRTESYASSDIYPRENRVTARDGMSKHISVQKDAAASAGIPIHIGEYGIPKGWQGRTNFMCDKTTVYNNLDVARTAWVWNKDIDGHFGMWDPATGWINWVDGIFYSNCQ